MDHVAVVEHHQKNSGATPVNVYRRVHNVSESPDVRRITRTATLACKVPPCDPDVISVKRPSTLKFFTCARAAEVDSTVNIGCRVSAGPNSRSTTKLSRATREVQEGMAGKLKGKIMLLPTPSSVSPTRKPRLKVIRTHSSPESRGRQRLVSTDTLPYG